MVFGFVAPEVEADAIGEGGEFEEGAEVHGGVGEGLGAGEFERLGAVGFDLAGDAFQLGFFEDAAGEFGAAGVEGEGGDLGVVPGAVVVLGFGLVETVFTGEQPVEVIGKPAAHASGVGGGEGFGGFEPTEFLAEVDKEGGVDDADAAAVDAAGNGLSEIEVRVHAGGGVEEPVAQQLSCMSGEALVAGFAVGEGEVGDGLVHAFHGGSVGGGGEAVGIGFAVTADVGEAVGFGGVGPPVGANAHVVVLVSARRRGGFLHDAEGPGGEGFGGFLKEFLEGGGGWRLDG